MIVVVKFQMCFLSISFYENKMLFKTCFFINCRFPLPSMRSPSVNVSLDSGLTENGQTGKKYIHIYI